MNVFPTYCGYCSCIDKYLSLYTWPASLETPLTHSLFPAAHSLIKQLRQKYRPSLVLAVNNAEFAENICYVKRDGVAG